MPTPSDILSRPEEATAELGELSRVPSRQRLGVCPQRLVGLFEGIGISAPSTVTSSKVSCNIIIGRPSRENRNQGPYEQSTEITTVSLLFIASSVTGSEAEHQIITHYEVFEERLADRDLLLSAIAAQHSETIEVRFRNPDEPRLCS